jgi:hypothetical protein
MASSTIATEGVAWLYLFLFGNTEHRRAMSKEEDVKKAGLMTRDAIMVNCQLDLGYNHLYPSAVNINIINRRHPKIRKCKWASYVRKGMRLKIRTTMDARAVLLLLQHVTDDVLYRTCTVGRLCTSNGTYGVRTAQTPSSRGDILWW